MEQAYSKASEDKFILDLKSRNSTLKSLQNSTIHPLKSNSLSKLRHLSKQSQQLVKQRFDEHLSSLKLSINTLEKECGKFGGIEFIRSQMDRNELAKGEYLDYCLSRINKHFELPTVKTRTLSQRSLKHNKQSKNSNIRYNKWFIEPDQRFAKSKEAIKYEWTKDGFIFNIVKKRDNVLENKYLPGFIAHSKEKLNRQPLFCKYTKVTKAE